MKSKKRKHEVKFSAMQLFLRIVAKNVLFVVAKNVLFVS